MFIQPASHGTIAWRSEAQKNEAFMKSTAIGSYLDMLNNGASETLKLSPSRKLKETPRRTKGTKECSRRNWRFFLRDVEKRSEKTHVYYPFYKKKAKKTQNTVSIFNKIDFCAQNFLFSRLLEKCTKNAISMKMLEKFTKNTVSMFKLAQISVWNWIRTNMKVTAAPPICKKCINGKIIPELWTY